MFCSFEYIKYSTIAAMYPYNHISSNEVESLVNNVELNYAVKHAILSVTSPDIEIEADESNVFQIILFSLKYLADTLVVDYKTCSFIDCMSDGGEASLYASTFNFRRLTSLELTEDGATRTHDILKKLPEIKGKVSVRYGCMRELFEEDHDVYFLDCTILKDTMLDEGLVVQLFFKLCKRVLSGSLAILVTTAAQTDLSVAIDDCEHMQTLFTQTMVNGAVSVWLYKIINVKPSFK